MGTRQDLHSGDEFGCNCLIEWFVCRWLVLTASAGNDCLEVVQFGLCKTRAQLVVDLFFWENGVLRLWITGVTVAFDLETPLFEAVLIPHLQDILEPLCTALDDFHRAFREYVEIDGNAKTRATRSGL